MAEIEKLKSNNVVTINGFVNESPKLNHKAYEKDFFTTIVTTKRKNGILDYISLMIPEDICVPKNGQYVKVNGEYRSYNVIYGDGISHLKLYVFVKELEVIPAKYVPYCDINEITLNGYLCKKPVHRFTPLGKEITDVLLAVNYNFHRSSYIPCIAWYENAEFIGNNLDVGDHLKISGRINSRTYKQRETGKDITINEVSIFNYEQ